MPLNDGYGVLIGTISNYFRDPPNDFGQYYHGNLEVSAPAGTYRCAIDVDSKQSNTGVEWRVVPIEPQELTTLTAKTNGFHSLTSAPNTGAMDYIRHPIFAARIGCLTALLKVFGKTFDISTIWKKGNSTDALADLEPLVEATRTNGGRVFVFGEPFRTGRGVHNIHQNQGDPITSQWSAENGIWQDGLTLFETQTGQFTAFLNKFTSQSYFTNDQGKPI